MNLVIAKISWSTIGSRGILFTIIWWILADGATTSWWIGVPAIVLALITSTALIPPTPFIWHEFLRFVPFFLLHSLLGGADVAWRAFHYRMPIAPSLIAYPLRLPPGMPQVFMANTLNLLPGTLSATLDQTVLTVHALDGRKDLLSELETLEQRIAALFGITLSTS